MTQKDSRSSFRRFLSSYKHKLLWHFSIIRSRLKLKRIDAHPIPDTTNELRLILMVRNEFLRLPYLLEYYFSKGVDRGFIIDNGSTDNTLSILLSKKNVHVFQTDETFKNYNNWTEVLLRKFGTGCWCIVIDADEILYYPYAEQLSIKDLCQFLDDHGHTSLQCLLLDMYSDQAISSNKYQPGKDPLNVCPYFDPDYDILETKWINQRTQKKYAFNMFTGNMRKRIFGSDANLSKFPLFRYSSQVFPGPGRHGIDGTVMSNIQGVVFHFKYLYDFASRVFIEAEREQHAGNAALYKQYAAKLDDAPALNPYCDHSVRFKDSEQLIRLGLMRDSDELTAFVKRKTGN